jgi:hypothetical protein
MQKIIVSFAVLTLMLSGCAGYDVKQVLVDRVEEYPNHAENELLSVSADPLDSSKKSEDVFNIDMNAHGFLATNVIIKNVGEKPFHFKKDQVMMVDSSGVQLLKTSPDEIIQSAGTSMAKWWFISGIMGAISADRAKKKMHEDFINKEIKDQVIPPGITVYGFVYFQHKVSPDAKGYRLLMNYDAEKGPIDVYIH